jgi:hypothetical protein
MEAACIKAAEELGYRAEVQDNYERYELRAATLQRDYVSTEIRVGNLFPAFHVTGIVKDEDQDQGSFDIWTGPPFGFASEEQVARFLQLVANHLP